ncbi:MAG: type III secretion system cytoplasmic ring protein SctQ [Luteimonas sp.]
MDDHAGLGKSTAKTARSNAAVAAQSLRGRIPALSAAQAQALCALFAEPQRWLLGDGSELHVAPGRAGNNAESFPVDADGTRLALRLDASAMAVEDGLHWSDYVGRSRLLAWSLAHESALMRLSDALGVPLMPVDADADAESQALGNDPLWLSFAILDGAGNDARLPSVRGAMRLPPDWLTRLIARAEPVYENDPLPELGAWRALPVPVAIAFDGPRLDGDAWRRLRGGDVIVLGRAQALRCEARDPKRTWPLAAAPDGWRIDGNARPTRATHSYFQQERAAMTDTEPSPPDDADVQIDREDAVARALPVQLAFEIGQLELSVGELASLQPGYVFALPTHLAGANVTLRANGRVAGRGEVVAVGDTLGVRLLSWN